MNINSVHKKEGIENIHKMNRKEINLIAKDIAIKLCLAFPKHNLNRKDLFNSISNINMYTANLNMDSSGAKYFSDINSIYFNSELVFEALPEVAMHECIHFIQMQNSKNQIGLSNFSSGIAINEAAVQIMASEANMCNISEEKLFGINLRTNSPNYYPLECAILKQMIYFTGEYPLYSSTLNSNDIFKTTFINKFSKRIYNFIVKNLDRLLKLESNLQCHIHKLNSMTKEKNIADLNSVISAYKKDILDLFFKIQNYIIKNCFCQLFSRIKDEETLYNFKNELYNFKDVIGYTENYTFYNDFYRDMMNALQIKKNQIKYDKKPNEQSLVIIDKKRPSFIFIQNTIKKIKKLIGMEIKEEDCI